MTCRCFSPLVIRRASRQQIETSRETGFPVTCSRLESSGSGNYR
jgi:hypothetical protein